MPISASASDVNRLDRDRGFCYDDDCRVRVVEAEAGTLVLDVMDARTNRLVWRGWAQHSVKDMLNEFFQERVQTAVEKGLGARGLEKAASGPADLVLHYHASVTQRVDVGGIDEKYGYYEACWPSVFDAGTLTLDVVDTRTNRLVWRGWAESSLDGVIDNQQWLEQKVDEAVDRYSGGFPWDRVCSGCVAERARR